VAPDIGPLARQHTLLENLHRADAQDQAASG